MEEILNKYNLNAINKIDQNNMKKIIEFLKKEHCEFIQDIIEDYLDLFLIDYDVFVKKYNLLNEQFNHEYLSFVASDMNLLELFY